jgi:predicted RNA-binding protein YlxR (DUF448 family)
MTVAALPSDAIEPRADPQRRCLVTRESGDACAMVRFVVSPAGEVVPDADGKLPGRGLWLRARRDIVDAAVARGVFEKAARAPLRVSPDLAGTVEAALVRRCLALVGFARRAGAAVAGFEKVRALIAKGRAGALIAASDGAPDGRAKLAALARDLPEVALFDGAELARVFGREIAVHAAIERGRIAEEFLREAARLSGFRPRRIETTPG